MPIRACRLLSPDSPHTPPQLWEWKASAMATRIDHARTFNREMAEHHFADWNA